MRVIRTILFILVGIGLLWLIFLLFNKAFSITGTTTSTTQQKSLSSYADTDAVAAMYIDGPVQSDQEHTSLRITVSRSQTEVELINGYEGRVVRQEAFQNNSTSYINFLKALDKAQFNRAVKKNISKDERGFCPLRNRFIYTLNQGATTLIRSWTSTCGTGNFSGNQALVRQLFVQQIPNTTFQDVLRGSNFSTF